MVGFLIRLWFVFGARLKSRAHLQTKNVVLRQQLLVLKPKAPTRVRLRNADRLVLVWLHRFFPSVLDAIVIVKPETVLRWHRRGFRAYWRWKSWRRGGRPRIDGELRALIRRMRRENPLWGAPPIVEAIAGGRQPPDLTVIGLTGRVDLPLLWSAQEQALGIR